MGTANKERKQFKIDKILFSKKEKSNINGNKIHIILKMIKGPSHRMYALNVLLIF